MCGDRCSSPMSHTCPPSESTRYSRSKLVAAPTALPRLTAIRPGSMSSAASPASAIASRAQTTANWAARSSRLISRGVRPSRTGSKSHSPATCERKIEGSKNVTRRVAVRPELSKFQNSLVPAPPGARTVISAITARRVIGGVSYQFPPGIGTSRQTACPPPLEIRSNADKAPLERSPAAGSLPVRRDEAGRAQEVVSGAWLVERRRADEQGAVQLLHPGSGVKPQLIDHRPAELVVHLERLAPSAGPEKGQHVQCVQVFVVAVL